MDRHRDPAEMEKSKVFIILNTVEYMPKVLINKTIVKRSTGSVTVSSLDAGEVVAEKCSPFDTFIHVIDGMAQLNINRTLYNLDHGEGIIIPAHAKHDFNASVPFKMITTVIKSGYED
jgi:quercetin dioxygenase-like cupin family protein